MDYIFYDENEEAIVIESREKEDLAKDGEARLEKYKAEVKKAAKK